MNTVDFEILNKIVKLNAISFVELLLCIQHFFLRDFFFFQFQIQTQIPVLFLLLIIGWYQFAAGHNLNIIRGRYTCGHCFKSYASKKGLDRHTRFECQFSPPVARFKCPYCSHESKRKDNLRQHIFKHLKYPKGEQVESIC